MSIDQKLLDASKLAAERLKLSQRLIMSWWISENGWDWDSATNNVGNISYQHEGVPSGGVFEGVIQVLDNKVCVYKDWESGVNAFVLLLETPKADKLLTLDLSDLHACGDDIHKMTVLIGDSNWAESHYNENGEGAGSLIWNVYNSPKMVEAFAHDAAAAVAPVTVHTTHPAVKAPSRPANYVIRKGNTLSQIALNLRVPMRALQVLNDIKDANEIQAGESLEVPVAYSIKPGDEVSRIAAAHGTTVEKIADMNLINPDRIFAGHKLFY